MLLLLSSLSLFLTLFLSRALSLSHSSSHHHAPANRGRHHHPHSLLLSPPPITTPPGRGFKLKLDRKGDSFTKCHRLSLQENLNENPNFLQPSYCLNEGFHFSY
ncbi:hypothetical protein RIF29_15219 [Crotalaria pallida]|uniref:Uncharacterized protein n=1 Tax=Crotalaria pallida TaxID=3830 RepID=A0AAN9FD40_CROPI